MGLAARKPVFWVSAKVRFKPACSATGTSKKIKGADQTVGMRRLVCTFVVYKPQKTGFLAQRPIWSKSSSISIGCICEKERLWQIPDMYRPA